MANTAFRAAGAFLPNEQRGNDMNQWNHRLAAVAVLSLSTMGCQSRLDDGAYIDFLREAMVESARLDKESGQGPSRADQAERAVHVWRAGDKDQKESSALR